MKRFWLFTFDNCYPLGGMQDFWKDFDSIEECHAEFNKNPKVYYQIFDSINRVVVFDSDLVDYYDVHELSEELKELKYNQLYPQLKSIYPKTLWNE